MWTQTLGNPSMVERFLDLQDGKKNEPHTAYTFYVEISGLYFGLFWSCRFLVEGLKGALADFPGVVPELLAPGRGSANVHRRAGGGVGIAGVLSSWI